MTPGAALRRAAALPAPFLLRAARGALALVYPPHCLSCGRATAGDGGVCGPCWRQLAFVTRPFCERLGIPFSHDPGPGLLSAEALARPPVYGRARAVVLFEDGPARRLVHRLKYNDQLHVAALLGRWMAGVAAEFAPDDPVLVPMPLHRGRLWRRQFNQAALLAAAMSRNGGLPWDPSLLVRVKPTLQQAGLSLPARQQNMQGAFRVPEAAGLRGRRLVLVDDVLTTGATANAAARALLRAGAESVDLVVFARVAAPGGMAI